MSLYLVIVWNNAGTRSELPGGNDIEAAKRIAKGQRTMENRTVKIARSGNSLYHWTRSTDLPKNHWSARATADEWFV